MKVFCDFHHGGLFYSMHLLWEKRLGMELYTMRGREWYEKGYWKVYDNQGTVAQYLEFPELAMEQSKLTHSMKRFPEGKNEYHVKMITLDQFKAMKFDYIVSSIVAHEATFYTLRNLYQPQAKLIRHMGNVGDYCLGLAPNILNSTLNPAPEDFNTVTWRQEFDTQIDYYYTPQVWDHPEVISSFLHNMKGWPRYSDWLAIQAALPEMKFNEFGSQNRDGTPLENQISDLMRAAQYIYHVKSVGDGYGHNVHHAFAIGRPLITRVDDYAGCIARELMVPDETVIDFTTVEEVARKIRNLDCVQMSNNAIKKFRQVVNFDKEEQDVRKWMVNMA